MPTKLVYLEEFDVISGQTKVESISLEDEGYNVVLSETVFYPKGGGQDYDQGSMTSGGGVTYKVSEVFLDDEGTVHHRGNFAGKDEFEVGDTVDLEVDPNRRKLNTRLHSAGHLVDMAVQELGYGWVPGKGSHYPGKSYVEYSGRYSAEDKLEIIDQVNQLLSKYVSNGGKNKIEFMDKNGMSKYCKHVPDYIPDNKPGRIVIYGESFGVPCGGTHVADLSEIGLVKVVRLKKKSGNIRLSYEVDD